MRFVALFALVLVAAGAPSCTDPAVPADPGTPSAQVVVGARAGVRMRVVDGVNTDVRDVPLLMAFDELTTLGYEVERIYLAANTLLADALARGDAEVGIVNNETTWSAIAKGADIRTVSEFTVYTGLIAAQTRIRSCRDLHGRPVAVPATIGFAARLFTLFIRSQCPGVEPQRLIMAESASRRTALLSDRIDAAMVPGEELIKLQLEAPQRFHTLAVPVRSYPGVRIDALQVRREWAEAHPEAVKALLAAQLKAHRLINANPEVLYAQAERRLSLDRATARAIADAHLASDIWDRNGGLTAGNLQSTLDFLAQSGAVPPQLRVQDVADLSYLDAVLREMGRAEPAWTPTTSGPSTP